MYIFVTFHTLTNTHADSEETLQTGSFNTNCNTDDITRRFWLRRVMNMFLQPIEHDASEKNMLA